jgi:energy-coupling factor transporter ATP-binding protein EcfA2
MVEPNENGVATPPPPAPVPPVVAKISKIALGDYRAFPAGWSEVFDLGDDGKNLLLYGENGSGKTSLFRALKELLNPAKGAQEFAKHRHIYTKGEEGFISIQLTAGTPHEFRWEHGEDHPRETEGQPYSMFVERCRFLDYKALLETNFVHREPTPNLFSVLVGNEGSGILCDLPVLVDGKRERLGTVHRQMIDSIGVYSRIGRRIQERADAACKQYSDALANHLPEVVNQCREIVGRLGCEGLEFDLKPGVVEFKNKKFTGLEIRLEVSLHGEPIEQPQLFLNEARLTALALAIYLGAAKQVLDASYAGEGAVIPVKLLVLDDVLIGLDLANRLPVLKLLEEVFSDWQIILMTYDRVWFDLARIETVASGRWLAAELYAKPMQVDTTVFQAPVLKPPIDVDIAGHFLGKADRNVNSDEKAAALYTRTAFEVKLKQYCHEKKVQVAYDLDGRSLTTDHFLEAVERRLTWSGKMPRSLFALNRVKLFRRGVLNPLAHYHPVTLFPNEVKLAISAVRDLEFPADRTDFMKEAGRLMAKGALSAEECIEAACWLRTAFEVDLRSFLVAHQGLIRFRYNWAEMTLAELWDSAKERMQAINGAVATRIVADIEAQRRIFLDIWQYPAVARLQKIDLVAAWNALRDTSGSPANPKTRMKTFS